MTETQTQAEDFSAFFLTETSALDIDLPNGEPMLHNGQQVRIHLYGPSTTQHQKASDAMNKEATRRIMAAMGNKAKKKEEEDKDADAKFLVAITARIENFPYPGGADAIYREPRLKYIGEQVRAHLADLGNFFKAGATA